MTFPFPETVAFVEGEVWVLIISHGDHGAHGEIQNMFACSVNSVLSVRKFTSAQTNNQ